MKLSIYILLAVATLYGGMVDVYAGQSESDTATREYQIKAAFLYNFFNFIDWPEQKVSNADHITIGVVVAKESKGFIDAIKPLTKKTVHNKSIQIKIFDTLDCIENPNTENQAECQALIESMKQCHLLMICENNHPKIISEIIKTMKGTPTLTVGEKASFLEKGGIINFVVVDHKVRFEINLKAAKESKFSIQAKLLKLAKRVLKEE